MIASSTRTMTNVDTLFNDSLALLQRMIATPSLSREEDAVATIIHDFLVSKGVKPQRQGNNLWAKNKYFDPAKPTILLNSHHDTVKPNPGYTRDPFKPEIIDGKLYGLGSNDAGGPLVSLIATFLHYNDRQNLKYNLVIAPTAEEEISGTGGIESIWSQLAPIDIAIVGEPTLTDMATAEKGLMVLDCVAKGVSGHAAREEGVNALYIALDDIQWVRTFKFPKKSSTLGDMKMTATIISAGKQHNVVPAECIFTIDVRVTDQYTLEEALEIIKANLKSEVTPRSLRMRPSGIDDQHPAVVAARKLGLKLYGSPTTSDQAMIPVNSVKMGPGDSARSHSADEYIFVDEIRQGITRYIQLLDEIV